MNKPKNIEVIPIFDRAIKEYFEKYPDKVLQLLSQELLVEMAYYAGLRDGRRIKEELSKKEAEDVR